MGEENEESRFLVSMTVFGKLGKMPTIAFYSASASITLLGVSICPEYTE